MKDVFRYKRVLLKLRGTILWRIIWYRRISDVIDGVSYKPMSL